MLGRSALLAATNSALEPWQGNYSDVSLLLRNGTPQLVPLDESPTPKAITTVGNASVTTAIARWNQGSGGSSLAFDGSGDSLTALSGADFNFGASPFTVECWVYFNQVNLQYQTIFSLASGSFSVSGFVLNTWVSNQLAFTFYNNSSNATFVITGASNTLTINTWYHVAVTRDSSNVFRLFLNGVKQGTDVTSTLSMIANRTPRVGAWTDVGGRDLNGYIDDLRITKGIARYVEGTGAQMVFSGTNTPALPTAQLPANITDDPSYNSVSLLLRGNETPSSTLVPFDESPTPKTISVTGSASITTTVFKYGTSALSFAASGGFSAPYSADLDLAGGDFTIEAWVRLNALFGSGAGGTLISRYTTTARSYHWWLYQSESTVFFYFDWTTDSSTRKFANAVIPTPNLSVFSHYVVARYDNEILFFVDGQKRTLSSQSSPIGTFFNQPTPLEVGTANALLTASQAFNGFIDDLRITKGIARYTSNFTPPPAELPKF